MMNLRQVRENWVRPALRQLGDAKMQSEAAENLLLGTFALESRSGEFLRQWPRGPAMGFWQVESATHADCWANWIKHRQPLAVALLGLVPMMYRLPATTGVLVDDDALIACPMYCCAIARIKYYRAPEPLPAADDWVGLEMYHKRWYNTALGATKPGQFIAASRVSGLIDTGSRHA